LRLENILTRRLVNSGGVSEWSIELVLKTSRGVESLEGSNPSPTAKNPKTKIMENVILSWRTKEFVHYEKGAGWYLTLTALGLLLIGYEIYLHDYFAALTAFVIYGVLYLYARRYPRDIDITITDRGVIIDGTEIHYLNIKRFWIVHHPEAKALHLETTSNIHHYLSIQLEDEDPHIVATALRNFIPESEPNHETLPKKIARKLRF
jgi:hypothetical protein